MNNKTLNIVFTGIIVIMILWIGWHRYLVNGKNINPWKLGGFAMYTTIHDLDLEIRFLKNGKEVAMDKKDLSENSVKAVNQYFSRKSVLGDLQKEGKISKILLEEKAIDDILIRLNWTRLNPETNRIETNHEEIKSR